MVIILIGYPSRTLPYMSQGIKAINESISKLVGSDNYQEWMRSMQSTLMALDLWRITSGTEVHPVFADPLAPTCNALAGVKAKHWRGGSQSGVGRIT